MDEERARALDEYRRNPDNDLADVRWFDKVPGMSGITLPPVLKTAGSVFRVTASGRFRHIPRQVDAVLRRGEGGILETLDWREA